MLPIPPIPPRINKGTAQGQLAYWDATLKKWTYTETSEMFWDDVNKRAGFGTDSPEAMLDVQEPIQLGDGTRSNSKITINSNFANLGAELQLIPKTSTLVSILDIRGSDTSSRLPAVELRSDAQAATGEYTFLLGQGTFTLASDVWHLASNVNGLIYRDSYPIAFSVSNSTDGRFEALRVANSGNIGINTTTPYRKLDILDSTDPQLRLTHTDGSVYTDLQTDSSGNLKISPTNGNVGIGLTPTARLHLPAGTTTYAPLKFTSGTALTTPQTGALEFNDDRFYITNVGTQRAIDRTSNVKIDTTTVVDTTTETTLHTGALSANALKVGNLLKFDANGIVSSFNAAQIVTIRFYIGSTEITSKTITGSTFTDEPWDATVILAVRSVGATGSVSVHGDLDYGGAAASSTSKQSSSIATINTTIAEDLTITAQWGTANAGNSISATQGFFEFKN